ncbi:Uncharacterised protein [uncultured archaeon]|nr:Uncharacterised protein [uncultured archaeon]
MRAICGPCIHCPLPTDLFIHPRFSASTVGSPVNFISIFGLSHSRLQCSAFPPKPCAAILSSMSEIILSGTLFSSSASPTSRERVIRPSLNSIVFTWGIFFAWRGCSEGNETMNSSISAPLTPILYPLPSTPASGFRSRMNASWARRYRSDSISKNTLPSLISHPVILAPLPAGTPFCRMVVFASSMNFSISALACAAGALVL